MLREGNRALNYKNTAKNFILLTSMSTDATDYLELIPLNERIVSFSRLSANSVRYHHWHQCLEILYVERGYGVIIIDNQQYTMRPGRMFIFPPFKLHKVLVEESQRELYQRTIIHLDNIVRQRYTILATEPRRLTPFSAVLTPFFLIAATRLKRWPACCCN